MSVPTGCSMPPWPGATNDRRRSAEVGPEFGSTDVVGRDAGQHVVDTGEVVDALGALRVVGGTLAHVELGLGAVVFVGGGSEAGGVLPPVDGVAGPVVEPVADDVVGGLCSRHLGAQLDQHLF